MLKKICLFSALMATYVNAQSTLGSILGGVHDASGAAVMGAVLTLRNLYENTTVTLSSGPAGLYEFLNLRPGHYELTAARAGFSTARTPEILLHARESRRADFSLQVAPK